MADPLALIAGCFARYCQYNDDGRRGDFVELFTEDCAFYVPPTDRLLAGRDELDRWLREEAAIPHAKHVTVNHVIDLDPGGSSARASVDFLLVDLGEAPDVLRAGRYRSRLRLEGTTWRFCEHRIERQASRPGFGGPAEVAR